MLTPATPFAVSSSFPPIAAFVSHYLLTVYHRSGTSWHLCLSLPPCLPASLYLSFSYSSASFSHSLPQPDIFSAEEKWEVSWVKGKRFLSVPPKWNVINLSQRTEVYYFFSLCLGGAIYPFYSFFCGCSKLEWLHWLWWFSRNIPIQYQRKMLLKRQKKN